MFNSFRFKLIAPVAIAFSLMIASAITFTVVMQNISSNTLNKQVEDSFAAIDQSIEEDLGKLSTQLDNKLKSMQEEASESLEESSSEALQKTAESVQKNLRTMRRQSGNDLLQLLAMVGTDSVITRDLATLNNYVRSAHRNESIVFLFYLDVEKKPLTRYLNRKNEKLKSYLPKGRPDIGKIIQAGQDDPNVLVLSREIKSEGEVVGSISLALNMTRARIQAEEMNEQFDDLVDNNSEQIDAILGRESRAISSSLQTVIKQIRDEITDKSSKTVTEITATSSNLSSRTRNLFILGSFFGFLMVLGILLLNVRSILKLLGGEPADMVQLAQRIANGDLKDSGNGKSVAGSLQAALLEMTENLRRLIGNIVGEGRALTATSTELALAAEDMSGGAEQSAAKADTVATATEEMSTNMSTVTMASEQAAQNVNVMASAMEEMSSAIQEIATNTAKASTMTSDAVTYAKSSSDKVNRLGLAANEISKVTEVITEISGQTNLLALNATIEAARAGEAGKGFAVVANEIKELAKQTADATGEIKAKIESIQSSTDETVTEITEISSVINSVNEIVSTIAAAVEEQTATAADISGNVNDAANGIGEVNENVSQASVVSSEIAQDITAVSQVSQDTRAGSMRLLESAQQLKGIANSITLETDRFDLGDNGKISAGTRLASSGRTLLRWNDTLSVEIDSIDIQHKKLIDLINELHQGMQPGTGQDVISKALDRLIEYTETHFKYEEQLFAKYNYPSADTHKNSHQKLISQVLEFKEKFLKGNTDISVELMEFLKDWLLDHIKKTDKEYSSFLTSKGVV